jgi:hypothetical protein
VNQLPKEREKIETNGKHRCTSCGNWFVEGEFYKSSADVYKAIGILPICKGCISKDFDAFISTHNNEKIATYKLCEKYNIPFYHKTYDGALSTSQKKNMKVYQAYFSKLNSFGEANSYGNLFIDGEPLDTDNHDGIQSLLGQSNKLTLEQIEKTVELTEQDKQVKEDVIRLLGYDVFYGYSKFDQKFLYNELISYLDEDTLDDTFKLSQILQIVNNNNQIRKLDLAINNMSIIANQGEIKSLSAIKNTIVQSTDKIAKENSISVKNRGDKKAGKSTFTGMMKQLRELNFEKAEQDYYTQKRAYGMQLVADISHKSILSQLQFDENDINDMISYQREMMLKLQKQTEDQEEEIRKLHIELDKYKVGGLNEK